MVTISAAAGSVNVSPVVPIKVAVAGGSLNKVSLTNQAGTVVKGTLAPGRDLLGRRPNRSATARPTRSAPPR